MYKLWLLQKERKWEQSCMELNSDHSLSTAFAIPATAASYIVHRMYQLHHVFLGNKNNLMLNTKNNTPHCLEWSWPNVVHAESCKEQRAKAAVHAQHHQTSPRTGMEKLWLRKMLSTHIIHISYLIEKDAINTYYSHQLFCLVKLSFPTK